jgi:hypothetical protein
MHKQTLLTTALSVLFVLAGSSVADAQSCQNQSCQVNSSGCYTCVNSTGSFCNLSGSCPQSCTEGSCNVDPCVSDPGSSACCAENPVSAGCPNPCINDPNAPEGCGTEIVCDGNTVTSCDGSGGGTGGGTGGSGCGTQIICLAGARDRSLLKAIATMLPRKSATSCQTASLPKNLLFSL